MNNGTPTKRTFHDIVHQGFARPRVRLFVDLTDFDSRELIQLFDGPEVLAKTMIRYAKSFGSLINQKVLLPTAATEQQYNGLSRSLVQEVRDFISASPQFPCVCVLVGTHPYLYTDAAEELASKGHVVVVVGKDTRESAQVPQHDLVYYLNAAKLADRGEKPEVEHYDFTAFIELLLTNETRMPFVSAKYFINKQMWRLGSQNPEVNQRIFQAARDRGVIELGKSENVDASAMPVTTCRLNREHPLVKQAIETLDGKSKEPAGKAPDQSGTLQHRMDLSGVVLLPDESDDTQDAGSPGK